MAEVEDNFCEIDGSILEGGGQILRISVALSALTGRSLHISKIRAGRQKPGLSNQHMQGIELVGRICRGQLTGCSIRSEEIRLTPGVITAGEYTGDSITAGSISLLAQVALPCALFASGPTTLRLLGGTNVDFSPPIDYIQKVLLPTLKLFGVDADLTVVRRGYNPKGGGEILLKIQPLEHLKPVSLMERGDVIGLHIYSYVAGTLSESISQDSARVAEDAVKKALPGVQLKVSKTARKESAADAVGNGSGIFMWAETDKSRVLAGSAVGSKPTDAVKAAAMLVEHLKTGATVDEHLQDQLIIFMALAKGHSRYLSGPLSLHTQTAIYICEQILSIKFQIIPVANENVIVECDGIEPASVPSLSVFLFLAVIAIRRKMDGDRKEKFYDIDGSILEGGGQILRISVALSALTGRPLRIRKIRAGRKAPGLSNQHMQGIELVSRLCSGKLEGCALRSEELSLVPGTIMGGEYIGDSITAGSVSLLAQVALPCALFADGPTTFHLRGGTNADFAPPIDYLQKVLLPLLKRFGVHAELSIMRRGYYPKGGGEVVLKVTPVKHLTPLELVERGDIAGVHIYSYVAGQLPNRMSEEMAKWAEDEITKELGPVKVSKVVKREPEAAAVGTGSGIFIWAETSTGCLLAGNCNGSKQKPTHEVASEAAGMIVSGLKTGAAVDEHLQDQLIIFMALAKGRSRYLSGPLSLHTQTAIYVCEQILGLKFEVTSVGEGNVIVQCDGIGFENAHLS
ncbi:RNA 3'-terminal phosphate cyclase [Hypsibius exemplaris]|uniref:RNA 3'-terminal phosphate cyclase n=1 Tax=Hypsibius exemplaris TaxID=2072580 RepID=A0A1W0WAA5_HYPEX|nr:RNA 3'-terminal phosphate cyclase [Hypsibius exemplaris]